MQIENLDENWTIKKKVLSKSLVLSLVQKQYTGNSAGTH